ncbi:MULTISPECIES: MrpF/PhaF family protein [Mycobacteriaceae]|uniref:MrpF/PhaF family protein n=1 Tax=Mycobacteriaceae TaxID=1762 RepID=UPI00197C58ED|nr:MrpF/PhaF family protein [Mycolicibacter senuensis]
MKPGELAALVLQCGVFLPGVWMTARGAPRQRLVGLEFAGVGAIAILMVLAISWRQDWSLIVALALALVTFPGTLVYTRLLAGRP